MTAVKDDEEDSEADDPDSSDSDDDHMGGGGGGGGGMRLPWSAPTSRALHDLDSVVKVPTHAGPSALFSGDGGLSSQRRSGTKGRFKYYVGIIDILQQYTAAKRAEVSTFL
jgi:hypothetical protein